MSRFFSRALGAAGIALGLVAVAALSLLACFFAFYTVTLLNPWALGSFALTGAAAIGSIAVFSKTIVPFAQRMFAGDPLS